MLWRVSAFILLFSVAFAEEEKRYALELTDETFRSTIKENEVTLVMFYAPWCGHCKALKPEFENAAKTLQESDPPVTLARMDCTEGGKSTCEDLHVDGYPTLKIYRNDEPDPIEYKGPREYEGIVQFMLKQAAPSSKEITTDAELEELRKGKEFVVVGFFHAMSDLKKAFWRLAEERDESFKFAHSSDKEMLMRRGVVNGVVFYRPVYLKNKFEADSAMYTGSGEGLEDFIKKNHHGLVAIRTKANAHLPDLPHAIVYMDIDFEMNPKGTGYWRNRILKVAQGFRNQGITINFAISDKTEFGSEIEQYGLSEIDTDKPLCFVKNAKKQKFVLRKGFSADALQEFVENVMDGKLEPFVKSAEVPEENAGPVKVAVGKTFDEVVIGNGKDTMVEFYAPWCGHCNKLKPKYEKLGKKMQNEDVDIVQIDATENDFPPEYEVQGFPTIFWVPKNNKDKPIKYDGGLKTDDLIKYIAQNSAEELKSYDRNGKLKDSIGKKTEL